jgi:DNA primase
MKGDQQVIDFVESHLTVSSREGVEYNVLCPIHGESHASMRVNVEKGLFFCHGCGARGGISKLARELGISYKYDRTQAGMTRLMNKLSMLRKGPDAPPAVLPEDLLLRYAMPTNYWTDPRPSGRGFSEETVAAFDLGYDPMADVATIPIRNVHGELIGITKRHLSWHDKNDGPKYRDPKHFPKTKNLFGSWFAAQADSPTVVITEGPLDCIKVWQAGHPAVALYGSHVSEHQIHLLRRIGTMSVVLFFDNDKAGTKAVKQAKGFTEERDGTWTYNPMTDLRKFFVVKRVGYTTLSERGDDPGDLSDDCIHEAVTSAKLVLR